MCNFALLTICLSKKCYFCIFFDTLDRTIAKSTNHQRRNQKNSVWTKLQEKLEKLRFKSIEVKLIVPDK